MKLSESLQKNIMETSAGSIINKFKISKRRNTLFFEDILAQYIKVCENAGYNKKVRELTKKWAILTTQELIPYDIMQLPCEQLFKQVLGPIWSNIGLMTDISVTRVGQQYRVKTSNEVVTKIIGPNSFTEGFLTGTLSSLLRAEVICSSKIQTTQQCKYIFEYLKQSDKLIQGKEKAKYDSLNYLSDAKASSLKDALSSGLVNIGKNNGLYFRGKRLLPLENTFFHLISNEGILMDKIPKISYKFFSNVLVKKSPNQDKLRLLKNLLQFMGLGIITISDKHGAEVRVRIENLPFGLQVEKDNWKFFIQVILGYLWAIDKDFRVENTKRIGKGLVITFSKNHTDNQLVMD